MKFRNYAGMSLGAVMMLGGAFVILYFEINREVSTTDPLYTWCMPLVVMILGAFIFASVGIPWSSVSDNPYGLHAGTVVDKRRYIKIENKPGQYAWIVVTQDEYDKHDVGSTYLSE